MDFNPVIIDHGFPRQNPEYVKPAEFEEMRELAAKLSQGIPFVRVDFFDINGHVYFGEYTFFDWVLVHISWATYHFSDVSLFKGMADACDMAKHAINRDVY